MQNWLENGALAGRLSIMLLKLGEYPVRSIAETDGIFLRTCARLLDGKKRPRKFLYKYTLEAEGRAYGKGLSYTGQVIGEPQYEPV